MVTFLGVARVPMAQIHRSSVWCNVLARAVACVRQTTCVIANMLETMILMMTMMMMMMMMMTNDHDDDDP